MILVSNVISEYSLNQPPIFYDVSFTLAAALFTIIFSTFEFFTGENTKWFQKPSQEWSCRWWAVMSKDAIYWLNETKHSRFRIRLLNNSKYDIVTAECICYIYTICFESVSARRKLKISVISNSGGRCSFVREQLQHSVIVLVCQRYFS